MPRPINLTSSMKRELYEEFQKTLNDCILDERVQFSKKITSITDDDRKIHVIMSAKAYCKQVMLVQSVSTEVAWHGIVTRNENEFYIEDILVHPQIVSGAKVDTDEALYGQWMIDLYEKDPNAFLHLNLQAHSHVNMSPSPSRTDLSDQKQRVIDLEENSFLVFMIVNKKGGMWISVYDKANNTIYDAEDIEFDIDIDGTRISDFIEESVSYLDSKLYVHREDRYLLNQDREYEYESW